jgi:hypothetical protein
LIPESESAGPDAWPELAEFEVEISTQRSPDELLYRQVHPLFWEKGEPASRAFRPTEADAGMLSVAQARLISAQSACEARIAQQKRTKGSWGVAVSEVATEGLRSIDDSRDPCLPSFHASVDFRPYLSDDARRKTISQVLRDHAVQRGCQYRNPAEP